MPEPSVRILGVYSPIGNASEYAAFVELEVASQNPINFSQETKDFLKKVGREDEIVALSVDELNETREYFEREFSTAVLIEALVENPNEEFDVGKFIQPNPGAPESFWQVAWCEKYLSPDGSAILGQYSFNETPTEPRFRVAFYIHDWEHANGLKGPYGALELPPVEPMPERLWKLAPYEHVD